MWSSGHSPFKANGADTFIAVSPSQNILYTCDPETSTQILRNTSFAKPAHLLGILNILGPTITGTDGPETRLYRKITAPFFNNETMRHVFKTSRAAAESVLKLLQRRAAPVDTELRPILARMALHIINASAFEKQEGCLSELGFEEQPPEGHELSYPEAMLTVMNSFATIFLTPSLILNYSPLEVHKKARLAYSELYQYLEELRDEKRKTLLSDNVSAQKSLLDLIVQAGETPDGTTEPTLPSKAVIGNMFIFMFAGHEASGNGIHFALLLLACRPNIQKELQTDIDRILGSLSPEEWTYEDHFASLLESMVGAVVNESLRIYTVLPCILKHTVNESVTISVSGRAHTVPPRTMILVNTSATHRNPRFWGEPKHNPDEGRPYAVSSFNPSQWLNSKRNDSKSFLSPEPGSFLPFSDGSRGCLGTRFALVELCVILARIFKEFSVELAVDNDDPTDSIDVRRSKWESARQHAEYELSAGLAMEMSLRMTGTVPLNIVRRGEERFANL